MSLETSIATATQEVGLAREAILNFHAVGSAQVGRVADKFISVIASMQTYLFVNQATGSDANPGTAALPLKTIDRAIQLTPFSGYCEVRLQSDYTLSAKVDVIGRNVHLRSDAPAVRRNVYFERLGDGTYRWPASFHLLRGGALLFEDLTINVPDIGGYGALGMAVTPGGLISSTIDGWSNVRVAFASCNMVIPAVPFCPVVQGLCVLSLHVYGLTLTGAITSLNGRLSGDQPNTAGVSAASLAWLRTNLSTI